MLQHQEAAAAAMFTTLDHLRVDVDRWEADDEASAHAAEDLRSYVRSLVVDLERLITSEPPRG